MSRRKKSDVWDFFTKENDKSLFATCNICKKRLSRGDKSHTTSNLFKHIRTFHALEFIKLKQQKQENDQLLGYDDEEVGLDQPGRPSSSLGASRPTLLNFGIGTRPSTSQTCTEPIEIEIPSLYKVRLVCI